MTLLRLTMTAVLEYEPKPEHYASEDLPAEAITADDMGGIDVTQYAQAPEEFLQVAQQIDLTYVVVVER